MQNGRKRAAGEGLLGFACFCASPQLTCVLTKFIANGLIPKCSQQVDLRTRSEVSANSSRPSPAALFLISDPKDTFITSQNGEKF